jgi:hypothetical protein
MPLAPGFVAPLVGLGGRGVAFQMIETQVKELKKLWKNKRQFLFQVRSRLAFQEP